MNLKGLSLVMHPGVRPFYAIPLGTRYTPAISPGKNKLSDFGEYLVFKKENEDEILFAQIAQDATTLVTQIEDDL